MSDYFLDRSMNRRQNRAMRSVLRRIARAQIQDPLAIMAAFNAARAAGWSGPDTKKATTMQVHLKFRPARTKVKSGFTKVWTRRKAARFAKFKSIMSPYPKDGAHAK